MLKLANVPILCKVKEKKKAILKERPNLFSLFKLMQYIKMAFSFSKERF